MQEKQLQWQGKEYPPETLPIDQPPYHLQMFY
jgi:hypothetical protein